MKMVNGSSMCEKRNNQFEVRKREKGKPWRGGLKIRFAAIEIGEDGGYYLREERKGKWTVILGKIR